jgi:hypothetical protein
MKPKDSQVQFVRNLQVIYKRHRNRHSSGVLLLRVCNLEGSQARGVFAPRTVG